MDLLDFLDYLPQIVLLTEALLLLTFLQKHVERGPAHSCFLIRTPLKFARLWSRDAAAFAGLYS